MAIKRNTDGSINMNEFENDLNNFVEKIENGEVAMSIIPDGLIKKMIKDDAALEAEKVA